MIFLENEQKYTQNATEIDEVIDDLTEHGQPQHAWDQVAAEQQAQAQAEGIEKMRTIEQEDLDANASLSTNNSSNSKGNQQRTCSARSVP